MSLLDAGRRPFAVGRADVASVRAFHARLPGYALSPLRESADLARYLGVRTALVKDERLRLGLPSYKILGAVWAAARCLAERGNDHDGSLASIRTAVAAEPDRLIFVAASDGNHGRAVARVAKLVGGDSVIVLPAAIAAARADAIARDGAQVLRVDGCYDDAVEKAEALAANATNVVFVTDTTREAAVDAGEWSIEGYGTIFDELDEQIGARHPARTGRTLFAVQAGTGALAAAAARHVEARWPLERTRLVTVEPESAACVKAAIEARQPVQLPGSHASVMATLNAGRVSSAAWPDIARRVDAAVAIDDEKLVDALRVLAAAGFDVGESGAAGLAGAKAYVEALERPNAPEHVIVLLTEAVVDVALHERLLAKGASPKLPN
jgi:diaminopropionate ammonia-lyase